MIVSRFVNALLAQAVCDAVGDPFEFVDNPTRNSILKYANSADVLSITDDTQMALFTADAVCDSLHDIDTYRSNLKRSYVEWYATQTYAYPDNVSKLSQCSELLHFRELWNVKSPGNTCLESCHSLKNNQEADNDSYGCGSVMRLLPNVLFLKGNGEYALRLAQLSGNMTHKHRVNDEAISLLMRAYSEGHEFDVPAEIREAREITELGEGWTALECVKMAIWANYQSTDFDDMMVKSINHRGDSDSVGAVAGSIWGMLGKSVPIKYTNKLDALAPIDYIINKTRAALYENIQRIPSAKEQEETIGGSFFRQALTRPGW